MIVDLIFYSSEQAEGFLDKIGGARNYFIVVKARIIDEDQSNDAQKD